MARSAVAVKKNTKVAPKPVKASPKSAAPERKKRLRDDELSPEDLEIRKARRAYYVANRPTILANQQAKYAADPQAVRDRVNKWRERVTDKKSGEVIPLYKRGKEGGRAPVHIPLPRRSETNERYDDAPVKKGKKNAAVAAKPAKKVAAAKVEAKPSRKVVAKPAAKPVVRATSRKLAAAKPVAKPTRKVVAAPVKPKRKLMN